MKKTILQSLLILALSLISIMGFARQDKVIRIYSNGDVVAEFDSDKFDYTGRRSCRRSG